MERQRYVVQLWGSNSNGNPHWMNVAHRANKKAAEIEMEWLITHGCKPEDIRIVTA